MAVRLGRWFAAPMLLLLVMAACDGQDSPVENSSRSRTGFNARSGVAGEQLRVVVSIPLFVSMVEAVGGSHVVVQSIVPAGVDSHTYQPSPKNARSIAEADVIFINGRGLEEWLSGLIESTGGTSAQVSELAAGIEAAADMNEHDPGHEHPEGNPHLWLDPLIAEHYLERIAIELSEYDPSRAADYQANAGRSIAEIQEFNAWAEAEIGKIPRDRRKLVTLHDAFDSFARHFGLNLVGAIIISPGREPSPRELTHLVDEIRAQSIQAIFAEPQFNPQLAETIAGETGVEILTLYSDAPAEGDDYLGMMRKNVEAVVEGLS